MSVPLLCTQFFDNRERLPLKILVADKDESSESKSKKAKQELELWDQLILALARQDVSWTGIYLLQEFRYHSIPGRLCALKP